MQVHQFHPRLSFGDAISNQILSVQRLLKRLGLHGTVFCEQLPDHFDGRARLFTDYIRYSSSENILLVHFSLAYSREVMAWLDQVPDRKVLVYHNITPHTYFAGVNPVYMESARTGREQLGALLSMVNAAWGDSAFNCRELSERGAVRPEVLPIVFDPRRYHRPWLEDRILSRRRSGTDVLFVGRVVPNKRFEDLILTFYYLKRYVSPDSRLLLVGSARGTEVYLEYLHVLAGRLGLSDVIFAGHVNAARLAACYRSAAVYLSMSEHEGFGVPLVESMFFGVPIVAYKAAAVPETLDGAGLMIKARDHAAVAELIGLLMEDDELRSQVIAGQRERLRDFMPDRVEMRLRGLLQSLDPALGGP